MKRRGHWAGIAGIAVFGLCLLPRAWAEDRGPSEKRGGAEQAGPVASTPLNLKAELEAADEYERAHDVLKAMEVYRKLLVGNRRQPAVLNRLAKCHLTVQDYTQAIILYKEALRYQPGLVDARVGLTTAYVKTKQLALAEAQYAKVNKADPEQAKTLKALIEDAGGSVESVSAPAPKAAR